MMLSMEMIQMHIKTVICDIDGTLMAPGGGLYVSEQVKQKMIDLQEKGILIILASARIFQGVLPLAYQIEMDKYGGYILSSNGTYAYDMKHKKMLFCEEIQKEDALEMWNLCRKEGVDFGIAQPSCMVASGFSTGFYQDHFNCDIDFMITTRPQEHVDKEISKCMVSSNKEKIDIAYPVLKENIESKYPYVVVRSTDTVLDIVKKGCGKKEGLQKLMTSVHLSFDEAAAIGDGNSDALMIQESVFGATLENGSVLCKQYADMITPSYKEDGCLAFFEKIMDL